MTAHVVAVVGAGACLFGAVRVWRAAPSIGGAVVIVALVLQAWVWIVAAGP